MKNLVSTIILLGSALASHIYAQVTLQALDAPEKEKFIPSDKCLERVKDRNYGVDGEHNFIYCAVIGPNGKKWLNLNLGAEYAREESRSFNPEAQPKDIVDDKAFGSLFQYGRKADGHELIKTYDIESKHDIFWAIKRKYPLTNGELMNPFDTGKNYAMINGYTDERWYKVGSRNNQPLWEGINSINNPCPEGYTVMRPSDVFPIPNDVIKEGDPGSVLILRYPNGFTLVLPPSTENIVHWVYEDKYDKPYEDEKYYWQYTHTSAFPDISPTVEINMYDSIGTTSGLWLAGTITEQWEQNIGKPLRKKPLYNPVLIPDFSGSVLDNGIYNKRDGSFSADIGIITNTGGARAVRCVQP